MDNITVVPLPDDATDISHSKQLGDDECISYWCKENLEPSVISLPPGQYDYLFTWPECSEEDCAKVVKTFQVKPIGGDKYIPFYKDYEGGKSRITAKSSFTSWLRSQGHNPESKFAILKKKV
jgi:hypothetical protein